MGILSLSTALSLPLILLHPNITFTSTTTLRFGLTESKHRKGLTWRLLVYFHSVHQTYWTSSLKYMEVGAFPELFNSDIFFQIHTLVISPGLSLMAPVWAWKLMQRFQSLAQWLGVSFSPKRGDAGCITLFELDIPNQKHRTAYSHSTELQIRVWKLGISWQIQGHWNVTQVTCVTSLKIENQIYRKISTEWSEWCFCSDSAVTITMHLGKTLKKWMLLIGRQ